MSSLQWGRSDEGAETRVETVTVDPLRLQWGRSDEGAETHARTHCGYADMRLQWGRSDEGAETTEHIASMHAPRGFNGAAPMKERKPGPMPSQY